VLPARRAPELTRLRPILAGVVFVGGLLLIGAAARDPAADRPPPADEACRPPAGLALRFCADVRPLHAAADERAVAVDQVRPCDRGGALPSFCIALPAGNDRGGAADPATLAAMRQRACAQLAPNEAPTFCLSLAPGAGSAAIERDAALALLRQRIGDRVRRVGTAPPDLWVEDGVPAADAEQLRSTLQADMAAVRAYLGREFGRVPAVFVFANRGSFAAALERHFGYPSGLSARLAAQSGGLLVTGIDAIVINAENVLGAGSLTILRHELAHVLLHELAGDATMPAWLDEGLATLIERRDTAAGDRDRLVSLALAADRRLSLDSLADPGQWLSRNEALHGRAYGIAAGAAEMLVDRVTPGGLIPLLEDLARGVPLATAYAARAPESLAAFIEAFPSRALAASCGRGIVTSAPGEDGLTIYELYGFPPNASVSVTVDRASTHLAFSVSTDAAGAYAGTLGGTMPPGVYRVRASVSPGGVEVDVPVGPGSGPAGSSCRR